MPTSGPASLNDFLPAGSEAGGAFSGGRASAIDFMRPGEGGTPGIPPGQNVDSRASQGRLEDFTGGDDRLGPLPRSQLGKGGWPMVPDARLTPGGVTTPDNPDFDGYWHGGTVAHSRRNVSSTEKARVAASYGVPVEELGAYEMDHYLPLSAGGSNSEKNLWPEPKPAADEKDQVEWSVYDRLKKGEISQEQALAEIKAFKPSGIQGRVTDFMPDGQERNRYLGQILPNETYHSEAGVVGHVLGALDFAGNVWRSALKGGIKGGQATYDDGQGGQVRGGVDEFDTLKHQGQAAWLYGKQAFNKERETTPSDLKDEFTKAVFGKKVRMGEDDGKFQWGDVGDIGLDLAVGVVTDPLTLLTEGMGQLAGKGGALAKGAAEAKAGLETVDAQKYLRASEFGRTVVGAGLGYGSADEDAPWYEKAGLAAAGAVAGRKMPQIGSAVRTAVEEGGDALTNAYAVATRGKDFSELAGAGRVWNAALEKTRGIANWIMQGRLEALDGLSETEREAVTETMHDLKNRTVLLRNRAVDRTGMIEGMDGYDKTFNQATAWANKTVREEYMPDLIGRKYGSDPDMQAKVIDAVNKWADHNDNVMGRLNRDVFGASKARTVGDMMTGKSGMGVPGLSFHVDDVGMAKKAGEADNLIDVASRSKIFQKRVSETLNDAKDAGLTPDQSYAVYANRFAKHFLDDTEVSAGRLMKQYSQTPASQGVVRAWETGLKGYDAMTNFAKANMLYFSTSWLRTQFFDNMSKAFVEGGIPGVARSAWDATAGSVTKQLGQDTRALLRGDLGHLIKDSDLKEAMQLGFIHDGMYKALSSDLTRDFLYKPDDFKKNIVARAYGSMTDLAMKNPIVKVISSTGSYMEGAGRMATYIRARDAMVGAGVSRDVAMKAAAGLVEKTFFNYSNVTMFENAVAKRLMPFYTFYSKNLPYWAKAAVDPEKVGRVAALDKIRTVIGTTPTRRDTDGMTPYIAQNGPRKLGKDDQGNTRYLVAPVDPRIEALKMVDPRNLVDTLKERGNPLLKTGYELATGKDTFTDDKLLPSDIKGQHGEQGRKYLFSRGYLHVAINDALKKMGMGDNPLGVDVDRRGNPYTTKDSTVVGDRLLDVLFPHGALDQVAAAVGKNKSGKENPGISAMNRLNPYQTVAVSPEFQQAARIRNAQKRRDGNEGRGDDGE